MDLGFKFSGLNFRVLGVVMELGLAFPGLNFSVRFKGLMFGFSGLKFRV